MGWILLVSIQASEDWKFKSCLWILAWFFSGCDVQIMGPQKIHQSSAWFRIKGVGFREMRWMWWRDKWGVFTRQTGWELAAAWGTPWKFGAWQELKQVFFTTEGEERCEAWEQVTKGPSEKEMRRVRGRVSVQEISPTQDLEDAKQEECHAEVV